MAKYRKKPVVIEAVQFNGDNKFEICEFFKGKRFEATFYDDDHPVGKHIAIATLEGTMCASPGDWIIKGIKGEFYPCKPDIFAASYEEALDLNDLIL